jgi:hypothetical protein
MIKLYGGISVPTLVAQWSEPWIVKVHRRCKRFNPIMYCEDIHTSWRGIIALSRTMLSPFLLTETKGGSDGLEQAG